MVLHRALNSLHTVMSSTLHACWLRIVHIHGRVLLLASLALIRSTNDYHSCITIAGGVDVSWPQPKGLMQCWVPTEKVAPNAVVANTLLFLLSLCVIMQGRAGELQQVRCTAAGGGVPVCRHGP